ncbi:amidohydrolase family protein [Larsenimonas rhizosphaerae]|uniref:amidohydrolase family protein n=1 Tax=Larsenimonas rhizosphaerae TaxID=2944682 RepID=UPI00203471C6|nr:amidohydrolase family protein [Larsenimonas rhizosphaerae]MCM2130261.1 amidohydrolase family protein [Larsenimonas rhizosphaerae]
MTSVPDNFRPLDGRAPRLITPPGATDCHIHLYPRGHEAEPDGLAIPAWAEPEDYRAYQRWLGLERVVLTQPNAYQANNAALLKGLESLGPDVARGVAVVRPDTPEKELLALHRAGVRGARIMQLPGGAVGIDQACAVEARVRDYGWHLMIQFNGQSLMTYLPVLEQLKGPFIIDHLGKFMDPVAADDARIDALARLMDRGDVWFKLCAPYESSLTGGPDFEDVGAVARRMIHHAPERVIWGSNWPHVGVPRTHYPDDVDLLDVLMRWASPAEQQRILVDNPAELYGFATP